MDCKGVIDLKELSPALKSGECLLTFIFFTVQSLTSNDYYPKPDKLHPTLCRRPPVNPLTPSLRRA